MNPESEPVIIREKWRLPRALNRGGLLVISSAIIGTGAWYGWTQWQSTQVVNMQTNIQLVQVDKSRVDQAPVGYLVYTAPGDFLPKSLADQFTNEADVSTVDVEGNQTEVDVPMSVAVGDVTDSDTQIDQTTPTLWVRDISNNLDVTLPTTDLKAQSTPWSIQNGNFVRTDDAGEATIYTFVGESVVTSDATLFQSSYNNNYLFVATKGGTNLTVLEVNPENPTLTIVYRTDVTLGTVTSLVSAPDLNRVAVMTKNPAGIFITYFDAYNATILKQEQLTKVSSDIVVTKWLAENPLPISEVQVTELES